MNRSTRRNQLTPGEKYGPAAPCPIIALVSKFAGFTSQDSGLTNALVHLVRKGECIQPWNLQGNSHHSRAVDAKIGDEFR